MNFKYLSLFSKLVIAYAKVVRALFTGRKKGKTDFTFVIASTRNRASLVTRRAGFEEKPVH